MMIRSTSTTSTIGVTLMPTMPPRPREETDAVPAMAASGGSHDFESSFGVGLAFVTGRLVGVGRFGRRRAADTVTSLEIRADQLRQRDRLRLDLADALLDHIVGHHRGQRDEQA